jgi:hypothetical protein
METELWELLVSLSANEISLEDAHDRILRLFNCQPTVIGSVCDGCGSKFDAMDIKVGICYSCQKEIKHPPTPEK